MSTLRVSNIEAKADVSSPTVDEKIKFTNSSGDVLFHLDGKTTGITTVGINTTGNTFTVNNTTGDISFSGSVTSSGVSTFSSDVSIADKIVHIGDTDTAIRFPSADTFTVETGGTERLRITSSGNVGIGTDNPDSLLTLNATSNPGIRIKSSGTIRSALLADTGSTQTTLASYEGYPLVFSVSAGGGTAERLRITSDGLVGVNHQNPTAGLSIGKYGTQPVPNGNTYPYPAGNWSTVWNTTTTNSTDYWVGFAGGYNISSANVHISLAPNSRDFSEQAGIYIAGEATSGNSADFTVGKIISGSVAGVSTVAGTQRATKSEMFRIKSNGNIGIGTDNPLVKTHVVGPSGGGGKLYIDTIGTFSGTDTSTLGFSVFRGGSNVRSNSQAEIECVGDGNYSGSLVFKIQNPGTYPNSLVERLRIDSAGHVTKPSQPCFLAYRSSTQTYSANNTIVFDTEIFDNNGDYNNSNGNFTAPVTGRYLILATVLVQSISQGNQFDLQLDTSNRKYYGAPGRTESQLGTTWGNDYIALAVQQIADMDANDVALIKFTTFEGGSIYGNTGGNLWTRFSAYLLC